MALDVWDLVRTAEVDLVFGDEDLLLRVEVFRSRRERGIYRGRLWRRERWVSADEDEEGAPDEAVVLVEWTAWYPGDDERFTSVSDDEALATLVAGLEARLRGAT